MTMTTTMMKYDSGTVLRTYYTTVLHTFMSTTENNNDNHSTLRVTKTWHSSLRHNFCKC